MKITFPHMGNAYIPIKALFEDLGVDVIVPPFCTKKTLEIGTRLSMEQACLPLKVNIGNYIESIRRGADTILLTGSCGPCRFGYYGVVQKEMLEDSGYSVDVIILDPPQGKPGILLSRIKKAAGGQPWVRIMKCFRNAIKIAEMTDQLEKRVFYLRPRERHYGDTDRIYSTFRKEVLKAKGYIEIKRVLEHYAHEMEQIPLDAKRSALKVGIIGEIYTIIEPFVNLNLEQKLGNMGIEVDRSLMVSGWVKDNLLYKAIGKTTEKKTYKAAKPYLDRCIGGHAWECIGHAIRYQQQGYDGAIQVFPFGCMPEIVAESILPAIEKDFDFPIMTLIVDEMTGETGYQTRLEAFADLLVYHHRRRKQNDRLFSGG